MKISPASELGRTCQHLGLNEDRRVCFAPIPKGVIVWDLETEKQYTVQWLISREVNFKTETCTPKVEVRSWPVPEKCREIFDDRALERRWFYRSAYERETIESELAFRKVTNRPHGLSRQMREVKKRPV